MSDVIKNDAVETKSVKSGQEKEIVRPSFIPQGKGITLTARPESLVIDPASTALIVVDMQNGYASKGGYFDLVGFDLSHIESVVSQVQRSIATARGVGMPVVFFKNGWDADYHEAGGEGSPNWHKSNALKYLRAHPETPQKFLARGDWDFELIDALVPEENDIVINKPRYSGFYNTALDSMLRSRGIRTLIFTGVATNVCVESTIRDGYFLEYFCVLLEDAAHQAGPREAHDAAVFNVEKFFGWVSDVDHFSEEVKK